MNTIKKKATVYGVGINDADYKTRLYSGAIGKQSVLWTCPFYRKWMGLLERCYSKKLWDKYPTYRDCTISEDWKLFSNFRDWMVGQDWEGMQLDKDILVVGNKHYSPETCVFVTKQVNLFVTDNGKARGDYLIGAYWDTSREKFRSYCNNPFTKKKEHLGFFDCEVEAHNAWLKRKLEHAYALAAIQTDQRVADALVKRYLYYEV